jgi:hypothetical protein
METILNTIPIKVFGPRGLSMAQGNLEDQIFMKDSFFGDIWPTILSKPWLYGIHSALLPEIHDLAKFV